MYIAYISHSTSTKNKLEEAFSKYLKSIDRTAIENSDVENFKKNILKKYNELCDEFSRCKPWPKHWEKSWSNGNDFWLRHSNEHFLLIKTKE